MQKVTIIDSQIVHALTPESSLRLAKGAGELSTEEHSAKTASHASVSQCFSLTLPGAPSFTEGVGTRNFCVVFRRRPAHRFAAHCNIRLQTDKVGESNLPVDKNHSSLQNRNSKYQVDDLQGGGERLDLLYGVVVTSFSRPITTPLPPSTHPLKGCSRSHHVLKVIPKHQDRRQDIDP